MNIGIIIGMASITVCSVFLEDYLNNAGKPDHARKVAMASGAGLAITAATAFIKLAKTLRSLG
jgi:hypothetical protein